MHVKTQPLHQIRVAKIMATVFSQKMRIFLHGHWHFRLFMINFLHKAVMKTRTPNKSLREEPVGARLCELSGVIPLLSRGEEMLRRVRPLLR